MQVGLSLAGNPISIQVIGGSRKMPKRRGQLALALFSFNALSAVHDPEAESAAAPAAGLATA